MFQRVQSLWKSPKTRMSTSMRSLSEISEEETVRLSVDLVSAARRNLGFLRLVSVSQWLHQTPTILESIRRYDELWMPLLSHLFKGSTSTPPMILPPLDIAWVWYCHTLNPVSYRQYCESRFSKLIGKAAIFNEENEEYAINRCKEIWVCRYPTEPFENESNSNLMKPVSILQEDLLNEISKQRHLYTMFSEPYYSEIVYLIAARQRYKGFLYMMHRFTENCSALVPTSDILLMLLTHQSYPTVYTLDIKGLEQEMRKVVGQCEVVKEEDIEDTKKLWERIFDQPYEKAGGLAIGKAIEVKPPIHWEVTDTDVNAKYSSMLPRFLLEVCLAVKLKPKTKVSCDPSKEFLRLQMVKCHKELKIDKPLCNFMSQRWQRTLHLYCEFGTKGIVIEVRQRGGRCIKGSSLRESTTFLWNDLLRAPSLTLAKEIDQKVRVTSSITPPVQASYLLKCVPDRVSDDSGAMVSDVILKMNQYHPQEGRWLSRTVLDHAGRECFVIRFRVGDGFWRRGAETPSAVKWEDRIIEVREGHWSYVAGSIGRAPEKVVGIAKPKDPPEGWHALWNLSTGDELLVRSGSESSSSHSGLSFSLVNQQSTVSMVKLLEGRQMQYAVEETKQVPNEKLKQVENEEEEEEDGFITVVRFSEDDSVGKATALVNWKLSVVEFLPEEDAVFILLLCMSIIRSISELKKEDVGRLMVRRRIKEAKLGDRDWGSVILHTSSYSPTISSPFLVPWYQNAKAVMGSQGVDKNIPSLQVPALTYSPAEGGDNMYKHGIINLN